MINTNESTQLPNARWRLIIDPPQSGPRNMAVDEAILEATAAGTQPPTLRLYAWQPAALSLGYAQSTVDADLDTLLSLGWDLVRRPTGGRAILHTDELTYSVCGPQNEPRLTGGVLESYHRLSAALLAALHSLNIPAEAQPAGAHSSGSPQIPPGPVCFEVPSNYEIVVNEKKLIGSAQARRAEGVLQHGSLPLYGDLTRITRVLRFNSEAERLQAAGRLLKRALTVEDALGKAPTWEQTAQNFAKAFERVLNLTLVEDSLSPAEEVCAQTLETQKYRSDAWTRRI